MCCLFRLGRTAGAQPPVLTLLLCYCHSFLIDKLVNFAPKHLLYVNKIDRIYSFKHAYWCYSL